MLILGQMIIFFLLIFAGALARRYNMIIPNNQEQFSSLIVNIACPCLIISAAMRAEEHMGLAEVIETYAAFSGLLLMMCILGFLLPLILQFRGRLRGAVNLSFWFNNSLFMGLPLVQGVYGDQAVVYMTLFFIPANLLFFVYGVSSISIHKRHGVEMIRMLLNPDIIASVIACVIYFGEITTPPLLLEAFSMIGSMTAPLAMMMIGASLKDIRVRHILTDRKLLLYTFLKTVVLPIPLLFIMKFFVTNPYILGCSLVIVAAPTGGMVAIVALLYNKVAYPLMTEIIALSTLVSVATIPLVSLITGI